MRQEQPRIMLAVAVLVIAGTSCDVERPASPSGAGGHPLLSLKDKPRKTANDHFAELNDHIPGFGGIFYDQDGTLVVRLVDARQMDKARPVIEAFLRGRSNRPQKIAHAQRAVRGMRAAPAKYEFRLLLAWYNRFIQPLPRQAHVVFSAIGHEKNKIIVGVEGSEAVPLMERRLSTLPIPQDAVEVVEMGGPAEASSSDTLLSEAFRPVVPGGVQIAYLSTTVNGCTLGFNLTRWLSSSVTDTATYFVTNSHCTSTPWTYSATDYIGQPLNNDMGGREVIDPPAFTVAPCPSGAVCEWTDAAVYKWDNSTSAEAARIAWPGSNPHAVSGSRMVVNDVRSPVEGDGVYKVGAVTGKTFGHIKFVCGTAYTDDGHTLLCQSFADYSQDVGDSGSPVVELSGTGTVAAVGIHRGKYRKCVHYGFLGLLHTCFQFSVFTPMDVVINVMYQQTNFIYDPTNYYATSGTAPTEFISETDPSPASFWAAINGTATAGPGMSCHWFSGTNLDYTGVEWYANNTFVGSSADLRYSASESFTLYVRYYNDDTGQEAWASKAVTVVEGAEQCYAE